MKNVLTGVVLLLFLAISCRPPSTEKSEEQRKLAIVYADWSEGIATSFLVKNVLQKELHYEIRLTLSEIDEAYEALAAGKEGLMLTAWLPHTHGNYYSQYSNDLVKGGIVYENAQTGILVPERAEIESIGELSDYTDTIYGIESSAGIMRQTREAIESYELDLHLRSGDEEKMLESLDKKYKRNTPVAITGWKPHLVFSRYELKFLQDPLNSFPGPETISSLVNAKVAEDEALMKFLSRFQLNQKQMTGLIREVRTHPAGEDAGAKKWMNENKLLVSSWTKNLRKFKEKPL